jgi:hypothetical protein
MWRKKSDIPGSGLAMRNCSSCGSSFAALKVSAVKVWVAGVWVIAFMWHTPL